MDFWYVQCIHTCQNFLEISCFFWKIEVSDGSNSHQFDLTTGKVATKQAQFDSEFGFYVMQVLSDTAPKSIVETTLSGNPTRTSDGEIVVKLVSTQNSVSICEIPLIIKDWNGVTLFWVGVTLFFGIFIAQIVSCWFMARHNSLVI